MRPEERLAWLRKTLGRRAGMGPILDQIEVMLGGDPFQEGFHALKLIDHLYQLAGFVPTPPGGGRQKLVLRLAELADLIGIPEDARICEVHTDESVSGWPEQLEVVFEDRVPLTEMMLPLSEPAAPAGSDGTSGPLRLSVGHRDECQMVAYGVAFDALGGGGGPRFVDEMPCSCVPKRPWRAEARVS